ncbi:unnamed protein product [Peronospora belbahrii]|uniref:Uncharacterized protein n=1 Tax=Peronospora belbahrii TaxID=622444 RepID=A0AAU9KMN7_9STRA|nr:unnamed protein product [Peronospora belbahrii]
MLPASNDRIALEKEIERCSCNVRLLENTLSSEKDSPVTIDDVAKEVKTLAALRKELKIWKQKDKTEEKTLERRSDKKIFGQADHSEVMEHVTSGATTNELELVQRATRLEELVSKAHMKLTMIETELVQMERSNKALRYLVEHEETRKDKETGVMEEIEVKVKPGQVKEADRTTEKLQTTGGALNQERSEAVAKLTGKLKEQRANAEHDNHDRQQKAVQKLLDAENRLTETITSISEEDNKKIAKFKAKLEEERFNVKQTNQEVESKMGKSVAMRKEKKLKLKGKLQTVEEVAQATCRELEKTQTRLAKMISEKETRETHIGKLQKNIEDLQLANKRLTKKNASIEADAKVIRNEAEKANAEHSSHKDKTRSLTAEFAAVKTELKMSKMKTEELQGEVEKLASEKTAANSKISSLEERILMLEQELTMAQTSSREVSAELESLRASSQDLMSKVASYEERVQMLKTELETATDRANVSYLELESLRTSTKDTISSLKERIQALTKELELANKNTEEVSFELDVLRTSTQEAACMHKEDIQRLTAHISELQTAREEGTVEEVTAELEKVKNTAKTALADKEETVRQLLEMKEIVNQLKLESEKAQSQASEKDVQVQKLASDLESRTVEVKKLQSQYDELVAEHLNLKECLRDAGNVSARNEGLLKETRLSLLETSEELKSARASTLKWKNSAEAAKTLMNAKIADAESASKQLKKARVDIVSVNLARSQLFASLEAKEKKIVKTKQELANVRAELAKTFRAREAERTQVKQAHAAQIGKLREVMEQSMVQLDGQVQSHRRLLMVLLPIFVAVLVYVSWN